MDFDIKIISLPEGKDPADFVKEDPEKWKKAVAKAENIMDFYFEAALRGRDIADPKDKKSIAAELLPLIKRIPNSIERSHWIKKLSDEIAVDEKAIADQLSKIKRENTTNTTIEEPQLKTQKKTRKELLEERILSIVAKQPQVIKKIKEINFSSSTEKIIQAIKTGKENDLKEQIDYLALKPVEADDFDKEIDTCLKEIKKENLKKQLQDIHWQIQKAEKEKDKKTLKKLTERAYTLSQQLQEL